MKTIFPFIMCFVSIFGLMGCETSGHKTKSSQIAAEYDALKKMSLSQTKDTTAINTQADAIIKNSEQIKETTASPMTNESVAKVSTLATESKNSAVAIHESVANIQKDNETILKAAETLKVVEAEKTKLATENTKLKEQAEATAKKTQQESIAKTQIMLRSFFGLGFGVMLIGAVLWVKSPGNLGMIVVGIGFLMVSIASAGIYYLDIMAKVGLFVFLSLFIPLIYFMVREVFLLDRSNKENIKLIEKTKEFIPDENREKIFGKLTPKDETPLAQMIQSPTTQKYVQKVREKEKKKKLL